MPQIVEHKIWLGGQSYFVTDKQLKEIDAKLPEYPTSQHEQVALDYVAENNIRSLESESMSPDELLQVKNQQINAMKKSLAAAEKEADRLKKMNKADDTKK